MSDEISNHVQLDNLFEPLEDAKKTLPNPRYRAQRAQTGFGIGEDNQLYTGLTLALVDPENFQGCDFIEEEINNVGAEAHILLPEDGLVEGHIYEAYATNLQTDWETGMVDDWDIQLIDVTKSDGDDSEEHF